MTDDTENGMTLRAEIDGVIESDWTEEEIEEAKRSLATDDLDEIIAETKSHMRRQLLQHIHEEDLEELNVSVERVDNNE